MNWEYGITTVPARRLTTLPDTLASLAAAGFDRPRLFVDGESEAEYVDDPTAGLPITARMPEVGPFANWLLGVWELYLRNPAADRYAMFEDDILAVPHLRQYLERDVPRGGYLNCYTCDLHQDILAAGRGWHPVSRQAIGRQGKGALGLVFDRDGIREMLRQPHLANHPCRKRIGRRNQDGAAWRAMIGAGRCEYVHNPSLLQHTGNTSVIQPADFLFCRASSFDASLNLRD